MKKNWLLFAFFFLISTAITAQSRLDGLWEGEITFGGLHSSQSYRFQLWLEVRGDYVTGRSYVYLTNEEVIEMDVKGRLYSDRSVYLQEVAFVPLENSSAVPGFYRKYQFLFSRSIWETSLEGYWQEMYHDKMTEERQLGRIKLLRVESMKP